MWGVCLTHPILTLSLCGHGEFLLHIPCLFLSLFFVFVFYRRSFSYISCTFFIFIWEISLTHPMLTHPMLASFLSHIPCLFYFYHTSRACFIFITHPMLASFFLHIPCLFYFYAEYFSYTSHAAFILCGGSFSDTSRAAFIFVRGVSLTHPKLPSFFMWGVAFIFIWRVSLTHPDPTSFFKSYTYRGGFCFLCEELLSSAVYSENYPLRHELCRSWPWTKM